MLGARQPTEIKTQWRVVSLARWGASAYAVGTEREKAGNGMDSSGAKGIRTLDLCIANAALSQLSYRPNVDAYFTPSVAIFKRTPAAADRWRVAHDEREASSRYASVAVTFAKTWQSSPAPVTAA
jgi:hypothetical protein